MYVPNQMNTDTFKSISMVGWKESSIVSSLNQSLEACQHIVFWYSFSGKLTPR